VESLNIDYKCCVFITMKLRTYRVSIHLFKKRKELKCSRRKLKRETEESGMGMGMGMNFITVIL